MEIFIASSIDKVGDANMEVETENIEIEGAKYAGKRRRKLTSEDFDKFESEEVTFSAQRTQLELYLDEPKLDRKKNLDTLQYWKANQFRFQELSIMGRDVLSISISTVASEASFSVGGRVLNQYRSALKLEVVETIICTRDWIFGDEGGTTLPPNLEELTEDISNFEISNAHSQTVECSSNNLPTNI